MTRLKRAIYVVIALSILVIADHATKIVAIRGLRDTGRVYSFLGDTIKLLYAENTGAFLSLGAGLPPGVRTLLLTGLNALILLGVLAYLFVAKRVPVITACALTLIAGGGIGNLIDRVFRDGRVVDFMNIGVSIGDFSIRTGIFNIADVAIMAGLFLIIIHELPWFQKEAYPESQK